MTRRPPRPRIGNRTIKFRLDDQTRERLDALTAGRGQTVSQVIRDAIRALAETDPAAQRTNMEEREAYDEQVYQRAYDAIAAVDDNMRTVVGLLGILTCRPNPDEEWAPPEAVRAALHRAEQRGFKQFCRTDQALRTLFGKPQQN